MKTEQQPFPLDKFNEWLAGQPGDREFNYCEQRECLFASFAQEALGKEKAYCLPGELFISANDVTWMRLPANLELAANSASSISDGGSRFSIDEFRGELALQAVKEGRPLCPS